MFKGKIGVQYTDSVAVSVRLTYCLTKFFNSNYISEKKTIFFESLDDSRCNETATKILPFGVSFDPVMELLLNCTWPHVVENLVIDSPIHSDLDPMLV